MAWENVVEKYATTTTKQGYKFGAKTRGKSRKNTRIQGFSSSSSSSSATATAKTTSSSSNLTPKSMDRPHFEEEIGEEAEEDEEEQVIHRHEQLGRSVPPPLLIRLLRINLIRLIRLILILHLFIRSIDRSNNPLFDRSEY